MFDDYTIEQLINLRLLCAAAIEKNEDIEQRADALLLLQYIEEELAIRLRRKTA